MLKLQAVSGVLALMLVSTGCTVPVEESEGEGEGEASFGEAQQPLNVLVTASWGSGNGPNPLNLGSDSNRTCFLTGIRGQLYAEDDSPPAKVGVFKQGGSWWLEADAGDGSGVIGDAVCVSNVSNFEQFGYIPNSSTNANTVAAPRGRECFLSHFSVTSGFAWGGSNTSMPGARLEKKTIFYPSGPELRWVLSATFVSEHEGAGGSVTAVCVNMPTPEVYFSWDSVTPLTLTSFNGAMCGLRRLTGNFFDSGPNSGYGALLYEDGGQWKARAGYTKGIEGACVR